MGSKPSHFRVRDLIQTLRGAERAGCEVRSIEIDTDGKIIMHMARDGEHWKVPLQQQEDAAEPA